MLFGKDSFRKKNSGKYIIGYELGKQHVQISYQKIGEKEPQTLSTLAGQEQYNIPFVLYKQEDKNLWFIGKEALAKQQEQGGILLTNLLEEAKVAEEMEVNLETYETVALLALFVKRSFSYLSLIAPVEKFAGIMFTVDNLDQHTVEILRKMVEYLQLPHINIQFMGKEESFFYYNLHTDSSLWTHPVVLYEMQQNKLTSYQLTLNRQTKPMVTLIEKKEYDEFPQVDEYPKTSEEKNVWDDLFLRFVQEDMEGKIISTVYLIGEGFVGEWYHKSVRFLCAKRRVFLGNNLYSKGACYGFLDKIEPNELSASYVYLGTDKLKANIGMELIRQGAPSYLAILDGGISWYDSKKEWDMILDEDNRLVLKIVPLDGKNIRKTEIVLHGLQLQKVPYCRIHVESYMENSNRMKLKIWDKGFGEFYPSTGQYWEETIEL
ncbi:MAG: hypothetical protein IKW30_03005 [Lachnospiraceae bacterium]|nr:hypothetical protein [Lachnospiraceae bacterium]